MGSSTTARAAIVGASGYTGAELIRLLLAHPHIDIASVFAHRSAGERVDDVYPQLRDRFDQVLARFDPEIVARDADVAFTALPHGASAAAVASLRERGVTVVDLSADFRLRDAHVYAQWYGSPVSPLHPAPALLDEAVYGLPELYREALPGASLIASPGCYPTAALLAIAPLVRAGLVAADGLVIDAKSGASGAGRTPGLATHLPEAAEGVRAYKVAGAHRHTVEIEQELAVLTGAESRVTFTPHLLPMTRGILACVYAAPTDPARPAEAYREAMVAAYAGEPFVSVLPAGSCPDTAHVRGSNRAHVSVHYDDRARRVIAMSAIDNLVKGASGQAIQALNIARAWPETSGLDAVGCFP